MTIWLARFLIGFFVLGAPSLARQLEEPVECIAANSFIVAVGDVNSQQPGLLGECVGVRGLRAGNVIVASQKDIYSFTRGDKTVEQRAVGLAGRAWQFDAPMEWGVYFGRLINCKNRRSSVLKRLNKLEKLAEKTKRDPDNPAPAEGSADSDDAIVITEGQGYCEDYDGPAIFLDTYGSTRKAGFNRLFGSTNRTRLGDLYPVPANHPLKRNIEWLARIALEAPCDPSYRPKEPPMRGLRESVELPLPRSQEGWQRQVALNCPIQSDESTIFLVSKNSIVAERGAKIDAVVCICTKPNCQSRWPISLIDTNRGLERPYICERMSLKPQITSYDEAGNETVEEYRYSFEDDSLFGSWWGEIEFAEPPG